MIQLINADRDELNARAKELHYMHSAVHYRSCPFGYWVSLDGKTTMPDGKPTGFIIFASIHFTRQRGLFGYPGLPTKWQVLSLARLWLHPDTQQGGRLYSPEHLPGFYDRRGVWRSTFATSVIGLAIQPGDDANICRAGYDWLRVHPPRIPNEPYHIRLIVSYSDKTHGHEGTIYRAFGFEYLGETISQRRHKNTRGRGMDDHALYKFVYRLPEPQLYLCDMPGQLHLPIYREAQP